MSDRIHVATRKGLFTIERGNGHWGISHTNFLADNCTLVMHDSRTDRPGLYCALDHGHFGAKLHRSFDEGNSWEECGVPTYPTRPEGVEPQIDMMGRTIPDSPRIKSRAAGSKLTLATRAPAALCASVAGGN